MDAYIVVWLTENYGVLEALNPTAAHYAMAVSAWIAYNFWVVALIGA